MPEVSVIVPNYNYANYLKERLASILCQTFQDFELIILDDKSTDGSKEIIEEYRNHPRVSHIIYNDVNSGSPFIQWNKGVELALGKWIWIAEADDFASNTLLEKLLNNAEQYDNIVLSYCQSNRMNSVGEITGDWSDWTAELDNQLFKDGFALAGLEYVNKFLSKRNTIPNASAVIFRRDVFFKVGKVDVEIKYCSDWLFWLKILTIGEVAFCSEKLNYFRFHEKSVIATSTETQMDILAKKRYLYFIESNFKKSDSIYSDMISLFNRIISNEYEYEAKMFKNKGLMKKSIISMWNAVKYRKSKSRIIYRFLFQYLFPVIKAK